MKIISYGENAIEISPSERCNPSVYSSMASSLILKVLSPTIALKHQTAARPSLHVVEGDCKDYRQC